MTGISVDTDPPSVTPPQPERPGAAGGRLAPLATPAFRRLATAYVGNELGNWLGDIALAVLVFDRTGSALATAALFVGTRFLPAFIAPALTARVEHLDTRRILPVLYALEAALFLTLAAMDWRFLLPLVVVLATLDGALAIVAKALTRAATVAVLKPKGQLRQGNALLNMGFTLVGAVGPVVAGLVVALISPGVALVLDAASFLAVAGLLTRLPPRVGDVDTDDGHWRARLREGLRYVRGEQPLRWLLLGQGWALLFFTLVIPVEVVYAKQTLDAGSGGYGALLTAWGVGMVAGGVIFARAGRFDLGRLLAGSALLIGAGYLAMAAAPSLGWGCAGAAVGGFGNGIEWVGFITALQTATRAAYQARVMSLFEGMNGLVPGVGIVLGGVLTQLTSPRVAFAVAGIGVLAVVLVGSILAYGARRRQAAASAPNAASTAT